MNATPSGPGETPHVTFGASDADVAVSAYALPFTLIDAVSSVFMPHTRIDGRDCGATNVTFADIPDPDIQ